MINEIIIITLPKIWILLHYWDHQPECSSLHNDETRKPRMPSLKMEKSLAPPTACLPPWDTNRNLLTNHPELHHYTDRSGLEGILNSHSIYATNFLHLNDESEISHLKDPWEEVLKRGLESIFTERSKISPKTRKLIRENGGIKRLAEIQSNKFIVANYLTAFIGHKNPAMAVPYISSFCSHAGDHQYEKENGLLSQWRGYGASSRFAIVFDTQKIDDLLKKEWEFFNYISLYIDSATYYEGIESINSVPEFSALTEKSIKLVSSFLLDNPNREMQEKMMEGLFTAFLRTATYLKHRAFKEEREIRIVAIPLSEEILSHRGVLLDQLQDKRPMKKIFKGNNKDYIRLFDNLGQRLPITRIIVEPGKKQSDDFSFAEKVTKGKINLVKSETPFIG